MDTETLKEIVIELIFLLVEKGVLCKNDIKVLHKRLLPFDDGTKIKPIIIEK